MVSRMLMFMWSFGALNCQLDTAPSKNGVVPFPLWVPTTIQPVAYTLNLILHVIHHM